jgi:hypothetical protein
MSKQTSVQQSVDMISEFLGPIRAQAQKEAEAASFKDTAKAAPGNQANSGPESTTQTTLGNEQSQAAKDSGSTAPDEKPNSEADAQQAADTQGTQTLTVDDKVREQGNIGPVSETEINQEQKMARASRLGNEILYQLEASLDKRATDASKKEVNRTPTDVLPAGIPNDSDGDEEGGNKLATQEEYVMHHLAKTASNAAQEFYEGYLSGMVKRAQDEIEVETSVPPSVLKQAGGVRSLLDKVAMENPEAVLPEGTELPPEISDIPEEGGIEEGGFPGAPEEGGIGDEDLEAIGAQLEEAGVTPEELQQAIEDVQALQEAGVSPEDLAAALEGGEGGIEEGGGDIPEALAPPADAIPEEILDPAAKEASGQTLAKLNEILNR